MAKDDDSSTAAHKVFAIPELLIPIICYLPVRDIISAASSVSKQWRCIVKDTFKIQETLLLKTTYEPLEPHRISLEPDRIDIIQSDAAGVAMHIPTYDESLEISDFVSLSSKDLKVAGSQDLDIKCLSLAERYKCIASLVDEDAWTDFDTRRFSENDKPMVYMQRNPFFLHDVPTSKTYDSIGVRFDLTPRRDLFMPLTLPLQGLKTSGGSWRMMFLTNPPITTILVLGTISLAGFSRDWSETVKYNTQFSLRKPNGLTWADVCDAVDAACSVRVPEGGGLGGSFRAAFRVQKEEDQEKDRKGDKDEDLIDMGEAWVPSPPCLGWSHMSQ